MDDIFCKIVNGETDTEFLFQNDYLVVFADIKPTAPVHYLIVPRLHIATINDIKEEHKELIGEMIMAARKAAISLKISEGYKLVFNVGEAGGQVVPHVHLHLLGGWE